MSTTHSCDESNELYCQRLASIAFSRYWIRADRQTPVDIGGRHYHNAMEFFQDLLHDPKLQYRMAVETAYVPSKWLLEQEMQASGRWANSGTEEAEDVYRAAAKERLTGVCFSGGGIRSATFNLGVLQGLAQVGLLPCIDYLSSVSGGGYIHEFFAAWVLRDRDGLKGVTEKLIPQAEPGCPPRSPDPIRWLLRYASYLTPARGFFSADTWTMVAIWMRNTTLNQIPILAGLGCAFFVIHLLVQVPLASTEDFSSLTWILNSGRPSRLLITGVAVGMLVLVSLVMLTVNMRRQTRRAHPKTEQDATIPLRLLTNAGVQCFLILPWLACAVWATFWAQLRFDSHNLVDYGVPALGAVLLLALTYVVTYAGDSIGAYRRLFDVDGQEKPSRPWIRFLFPGLVSTAAASGIGFLFLQGSARFALAASNAIGCIGPSGAKEMIDPWRIQIALLPSLLLSVAYFAIELTLGLLGREFPDARREWLARMRAWSLLYAILWSGLVGVVLLSPYLVIYVSGKGWIASYTTVAAFLTAHGVTIFAGSSSKSDGKPTDKGIFGVKPMDLLAMIASPIAVLGMLIALAYGVSLVDDSVTASGAMEWVAGWLQQHFGWLGARSWIAQGLCILGSAILALLFGWRVDINEFSMQSFYRNRLSRCYLGATVPDRRADPSTGFDDRQNLKIDNVRAAALPTSVSDLLPDNFNLTEHREGRYDGPFPIFCSTLNLTTGEDLATQERKGASFAFTPLYSGYSVSWTDAHRNNQVSINGYVRTPEYAYRGKGIHLDTAVAVSGAALNPNQGYNSNPALSFLMAFFNVRLGWWISNPRKRKRWQAEGNRPTPMFALAYLFKELIGAVSDASNYVNLSDGGHFENMGLYELVRRRCSYIVVCDAEADPNMIFEGIGSAITKCRADFGAEIDLDLRPLQIQPDCGLSKAHCVVGTIRYPPPEDQRGETGADSSTPCECLGESGADNYTGVIVYLKSSLAGDEPADLLAYKLRHDVFPHDMTADQWFAETQFESYRRLGHHIAMTAIQPALPPEQNRLTGRDQIGRLFDRMHSIWYPPTPDMDRHQPDLLRQYEAVLSELRARPELAGLAARLNDERTWKEAEVIEWSPPLNPTGSGDYAMQFANSLLDFMYTVYEEMSLAFPANRNSPRAQWWLCLFRRWCRVTLVRNSWCEHVAMHSEEFRLFARRELKLPAQQPWVE